MVCPYLVESNQATRNLNTVVHQESRHQDPEEFYVKQDRIGAHHGSLHLGLRF